MFYFCFRSNLSLNYSHTNRGPTIKHDKKKGYDILIIERNNDMEDYETSVSLMSNRNGSSSFNRSQKIGTIKDRRAQKLKYSRYKPFTLRDYTKNTPKENAYAKSGGLGPNIGDKRWQQEKLKRERMKDFSNRIHNMKKEHLFINRNL